MLWVGKYSSKAFWIKDVWQPDQICTAISFYISAEETAKISLDLYTRSCHLIAQLHTHPGTAFHSHTDDIGSMLLFDGQLSIVIPHYGFVDPLDVDQWKVYKKSSNHWAPVRIKEVKSLFQIL